MRTKVKAQDLDGKWFELEGEGLLARCLLHEFDHLTGKLLVDFVGPLKRQMIKRKLAEAGGARPRRRGRGRGHAPTRLR
jgi:peptide deformylase